MAQFRATFFFKDNGGAGWTETLYSNKATLQEVKASAETLAVRRTNLLGTTSRLVLIRVSDDMIKRDSLVSVLSTDSQSTRNSAATASDIAHTCLLTRMEAGTLIRRSIFLRGIPDDIVVSSGQFFPAANFPTMFGRWRATILADGWSIKSRDYTPPKFGFLFISQAAGGDVTVTTLAAHPFTANQRIVIRGVRGASQLNGSWNVFSTADTTHFVIKMARVLNPWTGGGTATAEAFQITTISDVIAIRVSHRIAGRPFDVPHGRRRALSRV